MTAHLPEISIERPPSLVECHIGEILSLPLPSPKKEYADSNDGLSEPIEGMIALTNDEQTLPLSFLVPDKDPRATAGEADVAKRCIVVARDL